MPGLNKQLDMFPSSNCSNRPNMTLANIKHFSNIFNFVSSVQFSYLNYITSNKFRASLFLSSSGNSLHNKRMFFPFRGSVFLMPISIVISFCSKKKMFWVHARSIVARMTHTCFFWNDFFCEKLKRKSVSKKRLTFKFKPTISFNGPTFPIPTFIVFGFIKITEKYFFRHDGALHHAT